MFSIPAAVQEIEDWIRYQNILQKNTYAQNVISYNFYN